MMMYLRDRAWPVEYQQQIKIFKSIYTQLQCDYSISTRLFHLTTSYNRFITNNTHLKS